MWDTLTYPQRVGLDLFDDLQVPFAPAATCDPSGGLTSSHSAPSPTLAPLRQTRVSRDEAAAIADIVRQEAQAACPGCLCALGGSYRRGQATSSDLDFILAAPAPLHTDDLLPELYRRLKRRGLLTHDLQGSWMSSGPAGEPVDDPHVGRQPPREGGGEGAGLDAVGERGDVPPVSSPGVVAPPCHTYFGICRLSARPGARHHRIDLKCFEAHEAPFALIAWTGNTPLSRSLRTYAHHLGYQLDELKLAPLASGKTPRATGASTRSSHNDAATTVPARSEFDVFSFLGLRFIPPAQRACFGHHAGAGVLV